MRNQITNEIKQSKKEYFQNFFTRNATSIKNTWKGIKSVITLKSTRKSQPSSLLSNGNLITDPKQVANTFNDYFSSIGTSLQKNIHHYGKNFTHYLGNANEHTFFIRPTSQEEVCNQIINLNSNKAEGPSSIPTNVLNLFTKYM